MFATLLGALPRPVTADGEPIADDDAAVVAAIDAQAAAGLDPVTDGRLRTQDGRVVVAGLRGVDSGPGGLRLTEVPAWAEPLTVEAWRFAAAHSDGLVKQALPGPYTLGRRLGDGDPGVMSAFAGALRREMQALADAGCLMIEIEELDAHLIGSDQGERDRFADAHRQLLDDVAGIHCSLAIIGGNADTAGIETILAAPYSSLAVDLIDGPDNWRLVTRTPGDRGIICGAVSPRDLSNDGPELLHWAASYAAASQGRGIARVGLATAGGLAALSWEIAERKMLALGRGAHIAGLPLEEAVHLLDPRAIDIRSAAMGRYAPGPRRSRDPG